MLLLSHSCLLLFNKLNFFVRKNSSNFLRLWIPILKGWSLTRLLIWLFYHPKFMKFWNRWLSNCIKVFKQLIINNLGEAWNVFWVIYLKQTEKFCFNHRKKLENQDFLLMKDLQWGSFWRSRSWSSWDRKKWEKS